MRIEKIQCSYQIVTDIEQNRRSLGINAQATRNSDKVLVNEFISQVLFPHEDSQNQEHELCMEKLTKVTVVNIRMSRHDALLMTTYIEPNLIKAISSIGKHELSTK